MYKWMHLIFSSVFNFLNKICKWTVEFHQNVLIGPIIILDEFDEEDSRPQQVPLRDVFS